VGPGPGDRAQETAPCRAELKAARALDPREPVVTFALGALSYNEGRADTAHEAIGYLAVAGNLSER
jgi:hypothetical protein